jgi:ketosteroid isomerase-like protein
MFNRPGFVGGVLLALNMLNVPLPAFAAAAASNPAAEADKASIEALETKFSNAFKARDVNAIMQCYAQGAGLFVFDLTPPRQHVGWFDYKKDWQGMFAAFPGPLTFSISDLNITVVGTVAYSHSIQQGQLTRKDGTKLDVVARVTDVYRNLSGRWLIVEEHVSVPVDLDSQKPDLLSKP